MDLSYNEDKEKRRRLTGEKTIRCCGQGENMEKYGLDVYKRQSMYFDTVNACFVG